MQIYFFCLRIFYLACVCPLCSNIIKTNAIIRNLYVHNYLTESATYCNVIWIDFVEIQWIDLRMHNLCLNKAIVNCPSISGGTKYLRGELFLPQIPHTNNSIVTTGHNKLLLIVNKAIKGISSAFRSYVIIARFELQILYFSTMSVEQRYGLVHNSTSNAYWTQIAV